MEHIACGRMDPSDKATLNKVFITVVVRRGAAVGVDEEHSRIAHVLHEDIKAEAKRIELEAAVSEAWRQAIWYPR